ncbi:hypothetical protein J2Z23_001897 [Lederbergia galactosidilyticus]|nr:hypothetical protein [Lederbergia galactosidilytica]
MEGALKGAFSFLRLWGNNWLGGKVKMELSKQDEIRR